MGLYDRTADRQTHPHPARFCCEQWIEYLLEFLAADPSSGVRHRYDHAGAFTELGPHADHPRPVLVRHRIDRVRDQVQKYLLQLDSVSRDLGYVCIWPDVDQYPVPLQIAAR